ncbi:DUF2977 domain-containing protein [bacterium]|nr:DUF2977 domain-containing protein [bacterium]
MADIDSTIIIADEYGSSDVKNIEVSEEIYNNSRQFGVNYYIFANGEIVLNPDYEQEQAQKERERKGNLFLTAADVERAIYKDKGIDFDDILSMLDNYPQIDKKAVKIELKANNFYRGNPYVEQIGAILGYSSEQLDYLFVNGEFEQR